MTHPSITRIAALVLFLTGLTAMASLAVAEDTSSSDHRAQAEANRFFERGNEFFKKSSLARAKGEYEKAIKLFPRHLNALYNLAIVCEQLNDRDAAASAYTRYLAVKPDDPDVWTQLGVLHDLGGKRDEARKDYEKAIQIDPKFGRAHHNLGVLLKEEGKRDEARKHLEAFVKLEEEAGRNNGDGYYSLAVFEMEQGAITKAKLLMQKALDTNPSNPIYQNAMGDIYLVEKEFDTAILHYQKAIDKDPKFALAYSGMGDALKGKEQPAAAAENYRKALELRPDYGMAHYKLGRLMAETGDKAEAIKHFEKYLESGKNPTFRDEVESELTKLKTPASSSKN